MDRIDEAGVRQFIRSGTLHSCRASLTEDGWTVEIEAGSARFRLHRARDGVRTFRSADALIRWLDRVGIQRAEIHTAGAEEAEA
ncbi:MAG: hypothetical protein ACLFSI_08740 [Halorhodospira sp.]